MRAPETLFGTTHHRVSRTRTLLLRGGRDLKTQPAGAAACGPERSGADSGDLDGVSVPSGAPGGGGASYTCSAVARPPEDLAAGLEEAVEQWAKSRDRASLRRQLVALLMLLEKIDEV